MVQNMMKPTDISGSEGRMKNQSTYTRVGTTKDGELPNRNISERSTLLKKEGQNTSLSMLFSAELQKTIIAWL